MKRLIKQLVPPLLIEWIRSIKNSQYGFKGDYSSWEAAESQCKGYADDIIFERVKGAALAVKSGECYGERDSITFQEPQYIWASLACLMHVAAREGQLRVLDFGGSLGSVYYMNRRFFNGLTVEWSIVEQPHFVDFGKAVLSDEVLNFFHGVDECLSVKSPNLLLLSSVIQYLATPFSILEELLSKNVPFVLLDRTPLTKAERSILTVQHVNPVIYSADYPAWIIDEYQLLEIFSSYGYEMIETFHSELDSSGDGFTFKGFFFQKVTQ